MFIGDSVSAIVNKAALEEATEKKITMAKAYSSVHDEVQNVAKMPARFPRANFTDVVPFELKKDEYEALVLQAGSVDISNLNTKDDPAKYIEYFKQEAITSAKNLFTVAVRALETEPTLKKVVLMKQTPRYDPSDVDPLALKPTLSMLFNNTLTSEWMESSYKSEIFIGNHNIDCTGASRESRYRNTQTGQFDGVHLYGSSGQKFYTLSVLNILKDANITSPEYNYHLSCPQAQHLKQARNSRSVTNKSATQSVPLYNRFSSFQSLGNY